MILTLLRPTHDSWQSPPHSPLLMTLDTPITPTHDTFYTSRPPLHTTIDWLFHSPLLTSFASPSYSPPLTTLCSTSHFPLLITIDWPFHPPLYTRQSTVPHTHSYPQHFPLPPTYPSPRIYTGSSTQLYSRHIIVPRTPTTTIFKI